MAVLLAALAQSAPAQESPFLRGIDVVPVKPTPTALSGIMLDGAKLPYPKTIHAGLLLDANAEMLALRYGSTKVGNLIPFRLDAHLLAAYQLNDKVELAGDLPFTAYQQDNFQLLNDLGYAQQGVSAFGLGDLRLLSRYVLMDPDAGPVGVAAVGEVRLPIGDGVSFLGDRAMVFGAKAAVERSIGRLRLLGNLGVLLRPYAGHFLNLYVRNQIGLGVGGIFRIGDVGPAHQLDAIAEMNLLTPMEAPFTIANSESLPSPWDGLVGLRFRVVGPFRGELAVGRGIGWETGYGREAYRVVAALRYDLDFNDRDGDGIPDAQDACPDVPEDKDGFEDWDGCPDPDNDKDGVADPDDQCPNDPGPKEFDGCPDRDQDDVPDNVDKCPDQAGPAENDGCPVQEPQVVLESNRIRIKGNIFFETASAQIRTVSFPMLDEVYKVLHDHPDVGPVRVEGHTDNRGSRPYNLDLSNRRAKSVMEYLIKKGIKAERLRYKGFGFDRPIASNATPLGRAKNRRVEFNLLERGGDEAGQELQETGAQVSPEKGKGTAPAQNPPGKGTTPAQNPPGKDSGTPPKK